MVFDSKEHIVMLPFMAHGHQIPMLEFATKLQEKTNFTVTIAATPQNLNYIRSHLQTTNNSSNPKIRLAQLPFTGTDFGLPPNTENTENLPLRLLVNLLHASTTLEAPVHDLVVNLTEHEGKPPLCIISGAFFGWATNVAKSVGTINVTFAPSGAYGTASYLSVWQNLPRRNTKGDEFTLPGFPATIKFPNSMIDKNHCEGDGDGDGTNEWIKFFQTQILLTLSSFCWLVNTVEEIEKLGLQVLRDYTKLPVFPIGPLFPASMLKPKTHLSTTTTTSNLLNQNRAGKESGVSLEKVVKWLSTKRKASVIYISFGSQHTITQTQMMELAKGLELSRVPFIWAVRPPAGFDITGEFNPEWLPENFEARMTETGSGLVIHKWAPQLEILTHESTGGFVTHCGWNSVLESLTAGVPIIGWPLVTDQPYNSKMLVEEMGAGVELCCGMEGVLTADDVKKVVSFVLGENGAGIRKNVQMLKDMIRAAVNDDYANGVKGSSVLAMDQFIHQIVSYRR